MKKYIETEKDISKKLPERMRILIRNALLVGEKIPWSVNEVHFDIPSEKEHQAVKAYAKKIKK